MNAENGYRVEAVRSGDWWAITVAELPGVFSQARRLDQIEARAREAIALLLDIDGDDVKISEVHVTPPDTVAELLDALQASLTAAAVASETATRMRRQVAMALRDEGLPTRDVGELIGVSHQRVSQILAS